MRILFTIPHYFNPTRTDMSHTSCNPFPQLRINAITACVNSIRELYSKSQRYLSYVPAGAKDANQLHACDVDIVICTTGDQHLVKDLPLRPTDYAHHTTNAEPMFLGFECHAVMRDLLGRYDYYCYSEDDNVLHDPWFFVKLAWFTRVMGQGCVLQPVRFEVNPAGDFEVGSLGSFRKTYCDGDLDPAYLANYQNIRDQPVLMSEIMGVPVKFQRPSNPHAGAFFVNARQMAHWVKQPYFLDRDYNFAGPLESAAGLGVLRTFRLYKPAPENAAFLEIEHYEDTHHKWAPHVA
jgi:hypothetical protein